MSHSNFKQNNFYSDGSTIYRYIEPDENFPEILIFENTNLGRVNGYSYNQWKNFRETVKPSNYSIQKKRTGGLKSKRKSSRWSSRWSKKRKSKLRIKSIRKSRKHHKK